jgi:16S rRNA (guanine966-N2)-methyltransferase
VANLKRDLPAPAGRNSVRIIGGGWRGRRVVFPHVEGLRPTPDRVRETLFNWLQHVIAGSRCLDLFAGSGVLGLEALSRGAADVVFVESAPAAARALQEHLVLFGGTPAGGTVRRAGAERIGSVGVYGSGSDGVDRSGGARADEHGRADRSGRAGSGGGRVGQGQVMEMGAARYLRGTQQPFDIVFLDPPFGSGALADYVPLLDTGAWLKAGALVYLENERAAGVPTLPARWELLKSKSAGEVGYHLARVNAGITVHA